MKLSEVIGVYNKLKKYNEKHHAVFTFTLSKLKKELKSHVEDFEESVNPSNEFQEFEIKRNELLRKYAEKDESGQIKFIDGKSQVKIREEDKEQFEKELDELIDEYKDVIEERNKQVESMKKLLEKEIEIKNVPKLKLQEIPEIEPWLMDVLVELDLIEQ